MADEETSHPVAELPRGVRKVMRGWEVDLDYPVEHDGQQVKTATVRRPNVGDIEIMARLTDEDDDASAVTALVVMGSRLLGLTEDEMRTVDAEDWSRIQEVIMPHMEKLQRGRQI
jgi:hypothetical protein